MHAPRTSPSPADVATEVANLAVGLGILTFVRFPFALPALLLVVGPLVPVAVIGVLLASISRAASGGPRRPSARP